MLQGLRRVRSIFSPGVLAPIEPKDGHVFRSSPVWGSRKSAQARSGTRGPRQLARPRGSTIACEDEAHGRKEAAPTVP